LKGIAFGGGSIRIEADRHGLDQGRSVGTLERIQPGMALSDLATRQPHAHCAIQPARPVGESRQQRLAQQQALTARRHCPKPQFPSLIPAVQDHAPPKCRALVPVPIQHSNQLFT
jgi:hypothetical protein